MKISKNDITITRLAVMVLVMCLTMMQAFTNSVLYTSWAYYILAGMIFYVGMGVFDAIELYHENNRLHDIIEKSRAEANKRIQSSLFKKDI